MGIKIQQNGPKILSEIGEGNIFLIVKCGKKHLFGYTLNTDVPHSSANRS